MKDQHEIDEITREITRDPKSYRLPGVDGLHQIFQGQVNIVVEELVNAGEDFAAVIVDAMAKLGADMASTWNRVKDDVVEVADGEERVN